MGREILAQLTRRVSLEGGREDLVAAEEPLEVRLDGEPLAVTMRTPSADEELAVGFLVGEGVLSRREELRGVGPDAELSPNVVEVRLAPGGAFDPSELSRSFYTSSSCGICGKRALEAVAVAAEPAPDGPTVSRATVVGLPERLRSLQEAFERTGGIHAAGIFGLDGEALVVREDVGRHNALDKAVGWAFLEGRLPLRELLVCVSGRLSFELVQKAALAGAPVLAGVSAPSSLAIELADAQNITLCGFVREGQMNVYTHPERLT